VLSHVDSEHEDGIENSLSWDESNPESDEVSDSYSEISASESDVEEEQDSESRQTLGKDGCDFILIFYNGVIFAPWYT
jgi:hypothetical protein